MTSLWGPGERNFNAASHKPTRAPIQSVPVAPVSFGLWDTALKFLSPGPRNDVTDHLAVAQAQNRCMKGVPFVDEKLYERGTFSVKSSWTSERSQHV